MIARRMYTMRIIKTKKVDIDDSDIDQDKNGFKMPRKSNQNAIQEEAAQQNPDKRKPTYADMNSILLTVFNINNDSKAEPQNTLSREDSKHFQHDSKEKLEILIPKIHNMGTFNSISDIRQTDIHNNRRSKDDIGNSRNDISLYTHQDYALNYSNLHDREVSFRQGVSPVKPREERRYTMYDVSLSNKSHSKSRTLSKMQSSSAQSLKYSSSSGIVFLKSEDISNN